MLNRKIDRVQIELPFDNKTYVTDNEDTYTLIQRVQHANINLYIE